MSETPEYVLSTLVGLAPNKVTETLKNKDLTTAILEIVENLKQLGLDLHDASVSKDTRMLAYETATRLKDAKIAPFRSFFLGYVAQGKINSAHFNHYLNYFKKHIGQEIDPKDFESSCGIGVEVSKEEVESTIKTLLDGEKQTLDDKGWAFGYGAILGKIKNSLPFARSDLIVQVYDAELLARLGPKPSSKDIKKKVQETAKSEPKPAPTEAPAYETLPDTVEFHDPSENIQLDPKLLEEHLRITGGKVRTRFPPEPNGYLHIGHAKSMNLNFGYAKKKGGICFMRFDDTNPEKEKQEYMDSILRMVHWLGHEPCATTYSSDYFPQLFEFAVQLIKSGHAYVCHQTGEEMARDRRAKVNSPWRDRSVEENLRLFNDMKNGKFKEGEAVLRMKGDMQHDNPNMRDLVAYRIKYMAHPHSGDTWCIYPSYDFTHCICDSLEHITHSLCTLEFENRKASYNWLLNVLGLYCPPQIEFSRLNLTYHVMSKRKLTLLVEQNFVNGWDDPRLPTIEGLKRRGYTAASINNFCERIGITRNANLISLDWLDECLRDDLNLKAPRVMAVLEPLKVTITNFGEETKQLEVPDFPNLKDSKKHTVPMSSVIYIDRNDFNPESPEGYYRLTPKQNVGLKYLSDGNLACKEIIRNDKGEIVEIKAELVPKTKVKAHIHWVSAPTADAEPYAIETRIYSNLFTVPDLSEVSNYLEHLNPNSLKVVRAYVDPYIKVAGDYVQFERHGFFAKDNDHTDAVPVWNRTVELKQDKEKKQ